MTDCKSELRDIMEPISDTDDITTEIIRRCEKILINNEEYKKIKEDGRDFNSIKIYGTHKEPVFRAKDIYLYVDPKGTNKTWFNKQLISGKHIFKANVRNIKSNENKTWTKVDSTNMLTRKGLMKALSICNGIIAETFQDYIFDLLDGLWKNEKDVILKQMKITEKNLEEERTKRREAEIVNLQNIHLQEAYCNDFAAGDSANTELKILRRLYLTKYYVYVADWSHVNAKYWKSDITKIKEPFPQKKIATDKTNSGVVNGIDLNSSDDEESVVDKTISTREKPSKNLILTNPHKDGIQEPYEFEFLKLRDLENGENEEYYFYISTKEITETQKNHFKFITHIYLDKPKHFTEMVKFIVNGEIETNRTAYPVNSYTPTEVSNIDIGDKISTPVKNVYKTTYDMMMSARSRSYIIMNRALLIK